MACQKSSFIILSVTDWTPTTEGERKGAESGAARTLDILVLQMKINIQTCISTGISLR